MNELLMKQIYSRQAGEHVNILVKVLYILAKNLIVGMSLRRRR